MTTRQRTKLWRNDYRKFIDDAIKIRTASNSEKARFFNDYNAIIAPILTSKASAFNIWANQLAPTHPPDGTRISLMLGENQDDYDTEYLFSTIVNDLADCVYHILRPVNEETRRTIILFRGTVKKVAATYLRDGFKTTEPHGYWADTNIVSVGWFTHLIIRSHLHEVLTDLSNKGCYVTFIGSSLGGNLAWRALKHQCKTIPESIWGKSDVYVFSAVGLGPRAARRISGFFNDDQMRSRLRAYWHCDDGVCTIGHYPIVRGTEYSQKDPSGKGVTFPPLKGLHTLPLASVENGWSSQVSYYSRVSIRPRYTFCSFSKNQVRQILGIPAIIFKGYELIHNEINKLECIGKIRTT